MPLTHAALPAPGLPSPAPDAELEVLRLGRVPYGEALRRQEERVALRQRGEARDSLFLLEHPPVITLGRGADRSHLLFPERELNRRGIEVFETGRGGDVTYHGPGQLVGYPILLLPPDRRDLHRLLRDVEEVLLGVAADFGIEARREAGLTGIWVGREKLAAIGMRVARWVTSHGFALNVGADLSGFDWIVPCGIRGKGVTSLQRLLGRPVAMDEAADSVERSFRRVFRPAGEGGS